MTKLSPIHPGEILAKEFLEPLGVTQYRVALDMGVPPRRINEIVLGRRGITAGTALRLAHYFGNAAEFWMNLQTRYDLEVERDLLDGKLADAPRFKAGRQSAAEPKARYRTPAAQGGPRRTTKKR